MVLNHESPKIFIEFSRVSQSRFPRGYVRLANSICFRKSLRISSFVLIKKRPNVLHSYSVKHFDVSVLLFKKAQMSRISNENR